MTQYLSLEQALFIHKRMIEKYGGTLGVRDQGLLESAIARPKTTVFGKDAYPTLFLKAAVLLESLVKNHSFLDGNKRVGFAAMHMMLLMNGYDLTSVTHDEVEMCLDVAQSKLAISEIADWIERHSKKLQ